MEKTFVIKNEKGMHIRPAGDFVKIVKQFDVKVEIEYNGKKVNGKSVMSIMSLGMKKGSEMKIIAEGQQEAEVLKALSEFVESGFGEI
jgi:phosphocarrier protein HPr